MVVCADTSFLFSLYTTDIHTPRAIGWCQASGVPVVFSGFTEYELGNAFRFAEFRNALPQGRASVFWAQYEMDCAAGRFTCRICNLANVLAGAKRLSASYTLTGGYRSFDILQVAAALELGAQEFLTFDEKQKRLAESEGLTVPV